MTLTKIELYRGDSYPLPFILKDASTRAAIDITGCSFLLTVDSRNFPDDASTQVFQVIGELDTTTTTGKVYFTPLATDTVTLGEYYFDIQMTDADGNIRTVYKSRLTIIQDITK